MFEAIKATKLKKVANFVRTPLSESDREETPKNVEAKGYLPEQKH